MRLQAWIKSIEQCKAGLAAPLLVQHPESGKILVNFDKEIMQLVREAKYMQRFNIAVPESAQMVLLQVGRLGLIWVTWFRSGVDLGLDLGQGLSPPLAALHPGLHVSVVSMCIQEMKI